MEQQTFIDELEKEGEKGENDGEESDGDFMYVDDDLLKEMDNDDGQSDDFRTMKESEFGSEADIDNFMDGDILEENINLENDSVCQLSLVHQEHVYCVAQLPHQPFNTFISGDGGNKCFVWTIRPKVEATDAGQSTRYECVKTGELEGHTETVEFIKFNFDGKLCVTGGMNNVLRVWQVEENKDPLTDNYKLKLKTKLENGPGTDLNFVEWHPKGNAVLCGGKDFMLYLLNGATGDFLACFSGHEDEVMAA